MSERIPIADVNSIIFHLDDNLKIYTTDLVNSKLINIFEHKRIENKLELYLNFDSIWRQIFHKYIQKTNNLVFMVGQDAGFTDTRIVFLWLKTHSMFNNTPVIIMQLKEFMSKSELYELYQEKVKSHLYDTEIVYSGEPRIGKP